MWVGLAKPLVEIQEAVGGHVRQDRVLHCEVYTCVGKV